MRRVHVTGGPGSGKTTLAQRVGVLLDAPVYEMDWVGWERDTGRERTVEEKLERVHGIAAQETWVTEGTMLGWTDALLRAADLVIWLDVPWPVAVWRMLLRHVRAELRRANPHPGWRRLARFAWYTRHYYLDLQVGPPVPADGEGRATRARTAARVSALGARGVRCRTSRDVASLLASIAQAARPSSAVDPR